MFLKELTLSKETENGTKLQLRFTRNQIRCKHLNFAFDNAKEKKKRYILQSWFTFVWGTKDSHILMPVCKPRAKRTTAVLQIVFKPDDSQRRF